MNWDLGADFHLLPGGFIHLYYISFAHAESSPESLLVTNPESRCLTSGWLACEDALLVARQ